MARPVADADEQTSWLERVRAVVAESLEPTTTAPSVALTLADDVERLITADWATRWSMLTEQPQLVHLQVAAACVDRDLLLALAIGRVAEAGVAQAAVEVPAGSALLSCLADSASLDQVEAAVRLGANLVCTHNAEWLTQLIIGTAERGATIDGGRASEVLRQHTLAAQARLLGVSNACLDEARQFFETDWDEVWTDLPGLAPRLIDLASGAEAWVRFLDLFMPGIPTIDWATDLRDLLYAAEGRGPELAIVEHGLVLEARHAYGDANRSDPQWLPRSADIVSRLLGHWADHHAAWVLGHCVTLARAVVEATPEDHPNRAYAIGDLGTAIAEQVQADLAPVSDLAESLEWAYEAVRLTPRSDDSRGTYAANLGYRLSLAVDTGIRPVADLLESIRWQREALAAAPGDDRRRPLRASMLSSRIAEAVRSGQSPVSGLQEAMTLAEEAIALTSDDHPNRAMYEINLALLLSEATEAGAFAPNHLKRAVSLSRAALERVPAWHPDRPGFLSSASSVVADAVDANAAPVSALTEALAWQEESVKRTSTGHPHYATRLSNLSSRLAHAALVGLRPTAVYAEAVRYARLALEYTPPGHPDRPGHASNLGATIEEAVNAGALPDSALAEATQAAREAWKSAPEGAPLRIGYASNLATRLATSGRPDDYPEALALARYCVTAVTDRHPARITHLSNLSSLITGMVRDGATPPSALVEAIKRAEEALTDTAETNPRRAAHESNLATALGLAVKHGIEPPDRLNAVISLATEAVTRTPATHPDRAIYLTNLMLALEDAAAAAVITPVDAARTALQLITDFRRLIRFAASNPVQRAAMLRTCEGLITVATPLVVAGAGPADGIRVAEGVRNLAVNAERVPHVRSEAVPAELLSRYHAAVEAYRNAQQRFASGLDDISGTARSQDELTRVLDEVNQVLPGELPGALPSITELAAHLPNGSHAVYLLPGPVTGVALILDCLGIIHQVELPGLSEAGTVAQVNLLLQGPQHALTVQGWLWDVVMAPILDHELPPAEDWIVVPIGHLSMLPVHAAGKPEGHWLDDWVTVRVLSSVSLLTPQPAPPATGDPVIAISNAEDLAFLPADRAVAEHFLLPHPRPLARDSTRDSVLTALAAAPSAVLSGHARHSLRHGAGLDLDDGPLTAEHLRRLPVLTRDIAIITACSSAQVASSLVDEVIGLPSALLEAGFRGVFATTWPVADATAFITLVHILQLRCQQPQLQPHLALHELRRALRNITTKELQAWFAELKAEVTIDPGVATRFKEFLAPHGPDGTPLADPKDWAAFSYIGR